MSRSAYYSRNNSYSKSLGAETAEREGRYSLTRAAQCLGISSAAFKKGIKKCSYTATEWHHVGKYANRVDYYDTTELRNDPLFWKGATTRSNATMCKDEIRRCIRQRLNERFTTAKPEPVYKLTQVYDYVSGDYYYHVSLVVETAKNISKGIREIIRKRKDLILSAERVATSGPKKFYLNTDGTMFDHKGEPITYSAIDWANYQPVAYGRQGGVRFEKINYWTAIPVV